MDPEMGEEMPEEIEAPADEEDGDEEDGDEADDEEDGEDDDGEDDDAPSGACGVSSPADNVEVWEHNNLPPSGAIIAEASSNRLVARHEASDPKSVMKSYIQTLVRKGWENKSRDRNSGKASFTMDGADLLWIEMGRHSSGCAEVTLEFD